MISIAEKVENHVLAHSGWSLINLELFVILLSLKFKPILIYFAGTETLKITRLLCQWLPVTLSLEGSKGKREDRKREKPLPSICSFLLVPASLTPAMLFSLSVVAVCFHAFNWWFLSSVFPTLTKTVLLLARMQQEVTLLSAEEKRGKRQKQERNGVCFAEPAVLTKETPS